MVVWSVPEHLAALRRPDENGIRYFHFIHLHHQGDPVVYIFYSPASGWRTRLGFPGSACSGNEIFQCSQAITEYAHLNVHGKIPALE